MGSPGVCSTGACTLCGNGTVNSGEQCDDGNTADGDGCSAMCFRQEIESNDTCAVADPIPLSGTPPTGSISGAISPIADTDWYSFTITGANPRSVRIETFVGGTGMCTAATASSDTEIFLYSNCATQIGTDDDDGPNDCSLIDPTSDAFARNLTAGTYYVRVIRFNDGDVINNYQLVVTITATCGNGMVEAGEACDDGNLAAGDGCNATCVVEPGYTCIGTAPSVCRLPEINCNDNIDNNGNGQTDSADASCAVPAYFTPCGAGQHFLVYPVSGPLAIPDDPAVVNSDINVTGATQVARAALAFNITHTYDADVDMYLTPPGGAARLMTSLNGDFGDNFTNTVFDSTCATGVAAGTAPFTGCYAPQISLASLNGTSANGVWRLTLSDNYPLVDYGTLDNWKLLLCTTP